MVDWQFFATKFWAHGGGPTKAFCSYVNADVVGIVVPGDGDM